MNQLKFYSFSVLALVFGVVLLVYIKSVALPAAVSQPASVITEKEKDTVIVIDTVFSRNFSDTVLTSVFFAPGDARLSYIQRARLKTMIDSLGDLQSKVFYLDGFADPTGSEIINNNALASNRAFSVYKFLLKYSVSKGQIYMRSFGSLSGENVDIDSARKVDISFAGVTVQ